MSVTATVRRWFADDDVIYECRHCGTALDSQDRACPTCGSTEIVAYDVS